MEDFFLYFSWCSQVPWIPTLRLFDKASRQQASNSMRCRPCSKLAYYCIRYFSLYLFNEVTARIIHRVLHGQLQRKELPAAKSPDQQMNALQSSSSAQQVRSTSHPSFRVSHLKRMQFLVFVMLLLSSRERNIQLLHPFTACLY